MHDSWQKSLGGRHLPFPPFPDCWIAFTAADDGTALEVYPLTHVLTAGPDQVNCEVNAPDAKASFVHAALSSHLDRSETLERAASEGWSKRLCNRGPFECVEVWLEDRLLVEVLDSQMQEDYRRGMTAANWAEMFGL